MPEFSPQNPDYRRVDRCSGCLLPPSLCLCAECPRIDLPVRFVIIRHRTEIARQSNTGGLAARALVRSQILEHGLASGPFDAGELQRPDRRYGVLFPGPRSRSLEPGWTSEGEGEPTLVVLDGSWRKSRRMARRITALPAMPAFHLPERCGAGLVMRKRPTSSHYFTLEAIAMALDALGFDEAATRLTDYADRVITRRLHVRGKLPRAAVD